MFVYTLCHIGAERHLKAEVAEVAPALRFAFSRPGFITFKGPDDARPPDWLIFARTWGQVIGQVREADGARRCQAVADMLRAQGWSTSPLRLLVASRDLEAPSPAYDEDTTPFAREDEAAALLRPALEEAGLTLLPEGAAQAGERVVEVLVVEPDHWFVGARVQEAGRWGVAGGRPRIAAPVGVPSRVWEKVEQGLLWGDIAVGADSVVLDIGCAPGGGPHVLLGRGARVIGVDPAQMAPAILANPRFEHIARAFELVRPDELGAAPDLVIFDVNLAPIKTVKPLCRLLGGLPSVKAALLTMKLNDARMVEKIGWMLEQVRGAGFGVVRATQLAANRQEICILARRA
jgi:23S rRNA (cytidine2498-2'-O)-methyltransferase